MIGASLGVVEPGRRELTSDVVLRRADAAMYVGKRRGKGVAVRDRLDRRRGPHGPPRRADVGQVVAPRRCWGSSRSPAVFGPPASPHAPAAGNFARLVSFLRLMRCGANSSADA